MDLQAILNNNNNNNNNNDVDQSSLEEEYLIETAAANRNRHQHHPTMSPSSSSSSSSSLAEGGVSDLEHQHLNHETEQQQQQQQQQRQNRRNTKATRRKKQHSTTTSSASNDDDDNDDDDDVVVDMDLERILRESDDDDEDDDDLDIPFQTHPSQQRNLGRHSHRSNYQRQQRQQPPMDYYPNDNDDFINDDDDDDADDKFTLASTIVTTEQHFLGNAFSSKPIPLFTSSSSPPSPHHQHHNDNGYHLPSSSNGMGAVTMASAIQHSAQEWAVLQAILGEDEEEEDDDEDDDDPLDPDEWVLEARHPTMMIPKNPKQQQQKQKTTSSRQQQPQSIVDAILVSSSSDDDEDDEDDHQEHLGMPNARHPTSKSYQTVDHWQVTSPLTPNVMSFMEKVDQQGPLFRLDDSKSLFVKASPAAIMASNDQATPTDCQGNQRFMSGHNNRNLLTESRHHHHHHHHDQHHNMKDKEDDEEARWLATSNAALSHAQAYERKLLKPAPRDTIVSPLQVKRRLKPKLQVQSKMQRHMQQQQQLQQQQSRSLVPSQLLNQSNNFINMNNSNNMNNNSAANMKKFGFSGVVELQRMPKISAVLSRNLDSQPPQHQHQYHLNHASYSTTTTRGVGLPTALAVNSKFIAVGTQGGVILVFDLFEVLRQELGRPSGTNTTPLDTTPTATSQIHPTGNAASNLYASTTSAIAASTATITTMTSAVSSLDLAKNGEVIIAGYTNGMLVLWDCIKGTALRTVYDLHPSPITSVRFVASSSGGGGGNASNSASSSDTFKVVSVDAGGLVYKIHFSKNILYGYSIDTDCLLDGTAGQILAMNVLAAFPGGNANMSHHHSSSSGTSAQRHAMERIVLIGLSSDRSSFCVAVEPAIHVLHRWAKPTMDRILPPGHVNTNNTNPASFLPCLSWEWALVSGGGHVLTPILARAWGCCLQLLRANFSSPVDDEDTTPVRKPAAPQQPQPLQWPAFGVHDEFEASAPVVAMEWLNERSLVYLTVTNEFAIVDTVMMTLLERLDFSELSLVYAEFSLSRSAASSSSTNPVPFSTTFQNSIRSSDDRIMVLCQNEVKNISIVGSKQRILALEQDGEWLEALALALDHYENTVKSQEDRKRDPQRRLLKHPEFNTTRNDDEEWIAKLLLRYLNLAVENAPDSVSVDDDMDKPLSAKHRHYDGGRIDLAQSHFQMLAGVCIEFCVVTRRLDLLYGAIFRRFQSVGYTGVFLDVMEPYVLSDKLDYIAPEVMAHFVEHCKSTNGIAIVERCLLHMDVTIMDFDSIIALLRRNGMFSALFYVFNQGLNDYITPLEIVLERLFDVADAKGIAIHLDQHRRDGLPLTEFEHLGYKAILYLRHCFSGKSFPQETEIQPEDRLLSLRPELLLFLLNELYAPSSSLSSKSREVEVSANRSHRYPYMHLLLLVDPRAMLETLALALDAPDSVFEPPNTAFESIQGWEVEVGAELTDSLLGSPRSNSVDSDATLRSPDRQRIISVLQSLIIPETPATPLPKPYYQSKAARNSFLDFLAKYLMKGVVRTDKNVTFMVLSRMAAKYATEKEPNLRLQSQTQILQLLAALPQNAYEADEVLVLVQSAGIHRAALLLHQEGASSWHEGINDFKRRSHHFTCAIKCYLEDDDKAFRQEVFEYIKKECSGSYEFSKSEDGLEHESLCDTVISKLPDLVRLDPILTAELVADLFIESFDGVISSLGDSDSEALYLFLHAIISGEMNQVDPVACAVLNANLSMEHHYHYLSLMTKLHPALVYGYLSSHDNYRVEECLKLCQEYDIADASAYLLERMGNVSSALQLLLQTLESRMMALKRSIRGIGVESSPRRYRLNGSSRRSHPTLLPRQEQELEGLKSTLVVALDLCERNSGTWSMRSEQGSQLWFNVLDRLINAKSFLRLSSEPTEHADVLAGVLSDLLRLTMQRMVSSVPLSDLVHKVTSDHSDGRLGELRELIDGLLGTYRFELGVFDGAHKAIKHDVRCLQQKNSMLRRSGPCVRKVMQSPITELPDLITSANLLTSSYTTLVTTSKCDAVLVENGHSHRRPVACEYGLGLALEQLRSRRMIYSKNRLEEATSQPELKYGGRLNMMTAPDKQYLNGESSEAVFFGERLVGSLGEAEHRGSLMMSYM